MSWDTKSNAEKQKVFNGLQAGLTIGSFVVTTLIGGATLAVGLARRNADKAVCDETLNKAVAEALYKKAEESLEIEVKD